MRKKRILLLVIFVLIIVILNGCNGSKKEELGSKEKILSEEPLRIAFNTWIGYSSFYIAEEKGFFKKYGILVKTSVIDELSEKNAAMLRGKLDGMGGTIDSAVISVSAGVKGKVVWMFDRSNGTDGILVADNIQSAHDLKGKSVAVEEGFVGHFFLLYYLEKNGLRFDDVKLIPMTTDKAGIAFVSGQVDVAVTWEPYLSTAKKRKGSRVLVSSKDLEPILADTLFISEEVIKKRSNDIQALVNALQDANNYWIANMEEGNKIVAIRWKMDMGEVNAIMETDELYSTNHNRIQFGEKDSDGKLYEYIDKCAKLWFEAGVIKVKVDGKKLIDPQFTRNMMNDK